MKPLVIKSQNFNIVSQSNYFYLFDTDQFFYLVQKLNITNQDSELEASMERYL